MDGLTAFGPEGVEGRDRLVGRIVGQLRTQGYFLAHVDSHAGQSLTDLRWAAQLAGREVGSRTRTYSTAVGQRLPGIVTVIVAPIETWSVAEVAGRDSVRMVAEELLQLHNHVGGTTRRLACRNPRREEPVAD